jgi:peptide/nickel transport system substrate-binding protein
MVAAVLQSTPVVKKMAGLTEDLAAGARGLWTLREAHIPGKDVLNVGHLWVWTPRTVWNPVGGFGDVYSADLWRAVSDRR